MAVKPVILAQNIIMRILVHERETPIRVIVLLVPTLGSKCFSVKPNNKTCWVGFHQMGNILIMPKNCSVEIIDIYEEIPCFFL